jgi:class I fructose-bisphosphate aldolase
MTRQANYLAATIEADSIKQKQAENNGGFNALKFAKTNEKMYSELISDHPIDLLQGGQLLYGPHRVDQFRRRLRKK